MYLGSEIINYNMASRKDIERKDDTTTTTSTTRATDDTSSSQQHQQRYGQYYSDQQQQQQREHQQDRKSTRLNSSHANISYAVFCLKKKKHHIQFNHPRLRT